jgi:glycosyltransferase involved in cell wall biosynthesis
MTAHGGRCVVHVVGSLHVGGLERVVMDLVQHIDRDRFSPRVVCLDEKGAWAERFAGLGVPVDCVARPGEGVLRRIWRLAGHLREVGADVVHAHNVKAHVQGGLAAALARVPIVVSTKHGRNAPDSFLARAASRLACRLSSHLVGVSKDCAAIWHEVERASESKVLVITNGVDLAHARAHVQSAPDGAHALCVARLNVVKDPMTLLHAARLVLDREPAFRLDLAGDGPLRDYVERAVRTLDLGEAVRVLGTVGDIDALMIDSDFFVLSSISEGISMTLLEAMAHGLPIVATSVGGTPEVVVHEETGLLVPPRDPTALADAIVWMIQHPRERRGMGRRGRLRVADLFNLDSTIEQYQRLYEPAPGSPGRGWETPAVHTPVA